LEWIGCGDLAGKFEPTDQDFEIVFTLKQREINRWWGKWVARFDVDRTAGDGVHHGGKEGLTLALDSAYAGGAV